MAIHLIRKLLPYLTSTSNYTTNVPCTDFCDPTCGGDFDECYTFPANPDSLPPLPPPLPPTTTIVASPSTSNDGFHLPPIVILVIIILASLFLLVSYYAIVIKYCSFWTRLIIRRDRSEMPQPDPSPDHPHLIEDQPGLVANVFNPVVDHPIWLISTVGLHQSVINSITIIRYKNEEGLIDGTDCSVCLSEFQEGETLRLLPKCNHAFHIDCIDTWLRSHTNCPLCRASIVVNTGIGSTEPSFGHSRRTEFTQIGDSDSSDVELGSTQTENGNNVISSMVGENRGETGNYEVDNQDLNKVEIDVNNPNLIHVRRSYSMDYRNGSSTHSSQQNSSSNTSSFSLMGSSSSSSSRPQAQAVPRVRIMKRSYSWSERVFWSTRNQNNRNLNISP